MAHITVELNAALGEDPIGTLRPQGADVGFALPDFEDARYPMLRLIDPYGDTVFNSYQMTGLIPELAARLEETNHQVLAQVIELAERCRMRRSYLVFLGD